MWLYVHVMLSLFENFHDWPVRVEREDRGGGGPSEPAAAPDHGTFWSNIGRLTATGRVADAPIPASSGRSGLCLRNPSTVTDGAMRWAADLGGSPPEGVCAGNPGRCSRAARTFWCQWPAAPGYYHGPAGGGMRRFDWRAKPPWTGRSENRVAVMPAMTEGQPEPTFAGCGRYRCRPCGGDMGEKGGYRGQQVGAASHTRRQ